MSYRHPSEFKENDLTKQAEKILGYAGRMLSCSKGQYSSNNSHIREKMKNLVGSLYFKEVDTSPRNVTVFNSNIFNTKGEKVWYGDIDITVEEDKLKQLARTLGTGIYVLYESDGRFDKEMMPNLDRFVYYTDGEVVKTHMEEDMVQVNGRLEYKPQFHEYDESTSDWEHKPEDFVPVTFTKDDDGVEIDEEDRAYYDLEYVDIRRAFDGLSEDRSPITSFFEYIMKRGVAKDDLADIWISKKDYAKLYSYVQIWYEVYNGEFTSDYRKSSDVKQLMGFCSPSHFNREYKWVEEGKIYLRTKYKKEKTNGEEETSDN